MDEKKARVLEGKVRECETLAREAAKLMIGKGLTLAQAESTLDWAKDLLKNAII